MDLGLSSTAKWGETKLRVALVLDNTGSMADYGKMPALQAATKSLLTQLQNAVTNPGDVYVSIIPFVKDSNLGASNWNSDYIYWGTSAQDPTFSDNSSWDANNGTCSAGNYSTRGAHASLTGPARYRATMSQTQCASRGHLFQSGNTTQSTCTGAGTCSISGETSQSTAPARALARYRAKTPEHLHRSGHLLDIGPTTRRVLHQRGHLLEIGQNTTRAAALARTDLDTWDVDRGNVGQPGIWTSDPGTWTPAVWNRPTWTPKNHNTWNGCVMDRGYPASPSTLSGLSGPDATNNYDTNVVGRRTHRSRHRYT